MSPREILLGIFVANRELIVSVVYWEYECRENEIYCEHFESIRVEP